MSPPPRIARPSLTALAAFLLVSCSLPQRPQFKPAGVDDDEAVQTWLDAGEAVGAVHSFVDDQVDITITIGDREPQLIACVVTVENRSQHDVVINFEATTIEDSDGTVWRLSGMAYSLEQDGWSLEWRITPGGADAIDAWFARDGAAAAAPTSFAVRLEGFVGPLILSDVFEFNRIKWP